MPSFSDAKVPDFIWANMLAGDVLLETEGGSGGTGGSDDMPLLNGECPKPGLNPVGSGSMYVSNVDCHVAEVRTALHLSKAVVLERVALVVTTERCTCWLRHYRLKTRETSRLRGDE